MAVLENLHHLVLMLLGDRPGARDDRGSAAAEYGVLLSLLLGTVIVTFLVLGTTITGT